MITESERLKEPLLHLDSAATPSGPKPVADHGLIALLDHIKRLGQYPLEDLSQAGDVVTLAPRPRLPLRAIAPPPL